MGATLRNKPAAETSTDTAIPTRADGTFYRFEMLSNGGWTRHYDDDADGLLSHLISGYDTLTTDQDRLTARLRHAVDMQVRLQARLNTVHGARPHTSVHTAVLTGPRHEQPAVTEWDCEIPLVLIDGFYTPYAPTPRPVSTLSDTNRPDNLRWLTPAESSMDYLLSLHRAALINLNITADEVA
jgi:hypothetical protein